MLKNIKSQNGATLLELIMFMGIIMILFGFVTFNLANFQQKSSVNTTIDTIISDIKSQQVKAMTGAKSNDIGNSYGVYFQPDRYILFTGSVYSSTDSRNFSVMLDSNLEFSNILFPASTIIFLHKSGELSGFTNGSNTISMQNPQGSERKTLTINKYGVITRIDSQ